MFELEKFLHTESKGVRFSTKSDKKNILWRMVLWPECQREHQKAVFLECSVILC